MRGLAMTRSTMPALAVAALLTGLLAGPAAAQSLTSVRGPGYPLIPSDARSMALGGLGIGLQGFSGPTTNPAALAHALRRGAVVSLEAVERTVALGEAEDEIGTTRFPLMRVVFPARGVVLSAGYAGVLDQSWALAREGEQVIGGVEVGFTDVTQSEGGVGEFQVAAAVPIGERLGVGASVGLHTGNQRIRQSRQFDAAPEGQLDPFTETLRWQYSGPTAQVGVQWDPMEILRVAGSVRWSGTLVGDAVEGRAQRRELDLPLQVAAGASGFLVPGLLASVSGRWSGWSVTDPDAIGVPGAEPVSARDTWEVGGGLEWAPIRPAARRTFPIRVGVQHRQLPFPFAHEAPSETFYGGGVGMRVGADPANPLAQVDLAVQRGTRTAPGAGEIGELRERMWRVSLSLALFGN